MTMPYYASVEQIMRDRSELARKGIARGRSVAVLSYAGGVLFMAETSSTALRKVSEIYDRIGFAAVGRYSEFDNLRTAGIRLADMRGYSYDRRDVSGRQLANSYAHALNSIFTEQQKPFEVEICVAEVGTTQEADQLYRITYDGTIVPEPNFLVMGGQAEAMTQTLRELYRPGPSLEDALGLGVRVLGSIGGANGAPREIPADQLEVAVLDRTRLQRAFRRIPTAAVTDLLPRPPAAAATPDEPATAEEPIADAVELPTAVPDVAVPPPDPSPGTPPAMPHTEAETTVAETEEARTTEADTTADEPAEVETTNAPASESGPEKPSTA
ncbi:MAG: proteasome subunit alpha [Actinomycetota bacterium]|nr:proteasome subunit alpha [Actinomycetota bacterium]